ncbi:hypothetical protein CY35_12G044700 [Sphagnum magellanicum]|nr:hypothetical protein CY35_12G044700 [Sphagnum magellanicum]KAH9545378.1 hypothetical protein CY35_12G044700 [Sphagnum magellanicum]
MLFCSKDCGGDGSGSRYQFPRLSLCCACFSQYQFGEQLIAGKVGVGNMDKVLEKSGVFRSWNQHPSTTRRFAAWDSRMDADARSATPHTTVGEEFSDSSMSSMNGAGRDPYVVLSLGSLSRHVPLQRLAVWTAVVITMFQLHDFVGIIMGTVVLSVVGNSVVSWAEDYLPGRRRLLVATMYVVILAALIGVGVVYIPRLTQEGAKVIAHIQNEDPYTLVSDKLRSALGEKVTDQLERFLLVMTKPDTVVMESVAGSKTQRLRALQQMIKEYAGAMVVWLATLISATSRFALQSLVSLIFSFMLVWDMPAIRQDWNFWCNFWEGNASTECHSCGEYWPNSIGSSCLASFRFGILVGVGIPLFLCASGRGHHFYCSYRPRCIHRVWTIAAGFGCAHGDSHSCC